MFCLRHFASSFALGLLGDLLLSVHRSVIYHKPSTYITPHHRYFFFLASLVSSLVPNEAVSRRSYCYPTCLTECLTDCHFFSVFAGAFVFLVEVATVEHKQPSRYLPLQSSSTLPILFSYIRLYIFNGHTQFILIVVCRNYCHYHAVGCARAIFASSVTKTSPPASSMLEEPVSPCHSQVADLLISQAFVCADEPAQFDWEISLLSTMS